MMPVFRARDHLTQLVQFTLALLMCAAPAAAQAPRGDTHPVSVSGTVVDDTGTAIPGARVTLSRDMPPVHRQTSTALDGRFAFSNVPPGSFQLTVRSPGFADHVATAIVTAGAPTTVDPIRLTIAGGALSVTVAPTEVIAERQIKVQEQQRVLGVVPNFLVSYDPNPAPLTTRQKFELSWKSRLDPIAFGSAALIAGIEQQHHAFAGFGDGLSGYAKRYAATEATLWTRGLMGQVVFPAIFRQDPRYIYKGTGSTAARVGYAVSRVVVRRGDDGRSHPNYSGILGSLAAGAISNLYYPRADRKGARLTLESAAIGLIGAAGGHLVQEFIFPRLTSQARASHPPSDSPATHDEHAP